MQDAPATDALLEALAEFLGREVVGAVTDPALQFRVRIAAHLCAGLAREAHLGVEADRAHLAALTGLLGHAVGDVEPIAAAIHRGEHALAAHIREAPLDRAAMQRLADGLLEIAGRKVAVGNPRFDRSTRFDVVE